MKRLHNWRVEHVSDKMFLLILALVVGFMSAVAAYVLHGIINLIVALLTSQFESSSANWLYLVYPVIGIYLTSLFVRYIVRDDIVISMSSTSSVKTSPAIGALKMPAIAPAAPQPTSVISVLRSMWNSFPRFEPMADPVSTIGASAPTEPPKPMVIAEAMTDDQQLCDFRRDLFVEIA